MATSTNFSYPRLNDGSSFSNWKFRVKTLLEERGLKDAINKDKQLDEKVKNELDAKAKSVIVQCISDKFIDIIKKCNTALEMLTKLEEIFERKSVFNQLYLRRKLLSLKCGNNERLTDHFIKFENVISELESSGTEMKENDKVCHLLLTLPDQYNTVITTLETMDKDLTIDFIKSRMLDAELKIKGDQSNSSKDADAHSFLTCFKCGKEGHKSFKCRSDQANRGNNRGQRRGNYRGRGKQHRGQATSSANTAEQQENNDNTSVTFFAQAFSTKTNDMNREIEFVIDSGATYHMINEKYEKHIQNISEIPEIKIQVANGNILSATRKGTIIGISKENLKIDFECLIVKNLAHNLISVLKLNEKGFKVTFELTRTVISKESHNIICENNGRLCKIKLNLNLDAMLTNKTDENLWHRRMGHLNYGSMKVLGLPLSNERCSICIQAKGTRQPFSPTPKPRTKQIGELIYCDLGGPVSPISRREEKYYLTIIDDYSHFMEVYLLKSKDEAKGYIINYIRRMKNNGTNVRRIRTDRGTEFVNEELKVFYNENGIKQETTCAYTPQQNSICERMNRTLADKVRAMLLETKLPKKLWGEAIRSAAYVINRSPTKALYGDTPANIWYGENKLEKIRVFGSKAWSVILPKPSKLEPRAKPMIMIGYCGSGYKLWNPLTDETEESRDVRFDESDYKYDESQWNKFITFEKEEETKEPEIEYLEEEKENIPELSNEKDLSLDQGQEQNNSEKRKQRPTKTPIRFQDYEMSNMAYALLLEDPINYDEAIKHKDWSEAIQKELGAHKKYGTWEISELPKEKKAIDTKWVFRTKADNTKKARIVAKGFQEETTENIYAPVARMTTVRLFLNKAVQEDLPIKQMDIPTAFLNGELKSDIYIKYPEGLAKEKGKVLKLRKALYGLKEAPRCWNEKLNDFLIKKGFNRSQRDFCLYTGNNVYILIFVDDILVIGDGQKIIQNLKEEFKAKDMGNIHKFLGMEIRRFDNGIEINQTQIIDKILLKFNMQDCKGVCTPMETGLHIDPDEEILTNIPYKELVGSLMYLATISRPDISYSTGFLSRYMNRPTPTLWKAGKRILRYLKQTKEKGLIYKKEENNNNYLHAFSDADWASENIDRKSVSGIAIFHQGNLISWTSKKQTSVALSTAEAEYVAAALAVSEIIFILGVLQDLKFCENINSTLFIDNQSTIRMIESYENSKRSKHIDIKVHYIKDIVSKGLIMLEYVSTNQNKADILTKALSKDKHKYFCNSLGLLC